MLRLVARTTAFIHRVLYPTNIPSIRPTTSANQLGAQLDPIGNIVLQRHTILFARPAQLDAVHFTAVRINDQRKFLVVGTTAVQWLEQRANEFRVKTIDANGYQAVFTAQRLHLVPYRLCGIGKATSVGDVLFVLSKLSLLMVGNC